MFSVTRNADINPDDEAFELEQEDFRKKMKKVLRQRQRNGPGAAGAVPRHQCHLFELSAERLPIQPEQVFITRAPLKLDYAFSLSSSPPR